MQEQTVNQIETERSNNPAIRTKVLSASEKEREQTIIVAKALGSRQRLKILDYLQTTVANVSEIAEALDMPLATVNLHLKQLEKAELIHTNVVTARRGLQKMCARVLDTIVIHLPNVQRINHGETINLTMPIGAFTDHQIVPTCGLVGPDGIIGFMDDPVSFYEPERFRAQLIWLSQGYLEYRFPYQVEEERLPKSLEISAELCSEAAPYHLEWPSDIFMEINGTLLGTWTSPSDFGGERGRLTPEWWGEWNSQYGLLKTWRVDNDGTFIDRQQLSDVTIADLALEKSPFIQVRFGVKPDAANMGGMNIFGKTFGNYAQEITVQLNY
ncbi:MAG: helix-turn-helix domain-containing protein [Chloroflexota bacterium]